MDVYCVDTVMVTDLIVIKSSNQGNAPCSHSSHAKLMSENI